MVQFALCFVKILAKAQSIRSVFSSHSIKLTSKYHSRRDTKQALRKKGQVVISGLSCYTVDGGKCIGTILSYITNMLPYMLLSLPFIAVWRILAMTVMNRRDHKTTALHEAGLIVFSLFLVGLASQTVIPKLEFTQTGIGIVSNSFSIGERLNLVPFRVFPETYTAVFVNNHFNYFLINFLGNIVMFMPIGFFIPLLWNKVSMKKVLLIGLAASLSIELLQLPLGRGTDIDDLWLNTSGTLLGFLVFCLLNKLKEARK